MTIIGTALSGLNANALQLQASAQNVASAQSSSAQGRGAPPGQQRGTSPSVQVTLGAEAGGGVSARLSAAPPYSPPGDAAQEVVHQIRALRSYQANAAVIRAADETQKAALAIA